jgi:transposase, IS30 family
MKTTNLTRAERFEISILIERAYSLRAIARALRRSPNTISYEVLNNSTNGVYDPQKADAKARVQKLRRRLNWRKIEERPELKAYVIAGLNQHWNPDEIAGRMRTNKESFYASKTAIYEWLRTARGERYCKYLYTKRKRIKKRVPKAKRTLIPNRVDITERPASADNRSRYGHLEADSIVGKKGTPGGLKVAYERKGRLVMAAKVASMRPKEHAEALARITRGVHTRTMTYDNGIENRDHEKLGVPSYFAHPYSSWEKGGVENANKMIRRYFPKGTDFREVSQLEVDRIVFIINSKPRKILGYRSALEVALKAGIISNTSVLTEG